MSIFRVRYMTGPLHTYVRVFVAERPNTTFAALGNLTMTKKDFEAFKAAFNAEFVPELDDK